ncbi:MAG: 1,4-dihydroxy-2-naphthoate octaprenyltransferase [Crocinitomicaceae bacterium]|nr:1,4-dihydroxy-2-naphthoate octaprenyltransferase [Crocinitomicaceae bacterium]
MVGTAVAYPRATDGVESTDAFWLVFGLVLLTVVLLQILSNWANDLGDYENGADGAERTDRMVASGQVSAAAMKRAIVALGVLAFCAGLAAVGAAFWASTQLLEAMSMVGLGVLAIGAAYRYTAGKNPYGYQGLGDLMVLIFFGWVGVGGTAFLLTSEWDGAWLLPGTWTGLMSTAVLNLNNMRDHQKDAEAGKRTVVVALGWDRSKVYHVLCFVLGWAAWWVFALVVEPGQWRGMGWIAIINAFHLSHAWRVWRCEEPAVLDSELKRVALSTAVAALFILLSQTGGVA